MQVGRCRNNGNAVVMPENEKKRENNTKKKKHNCTGACESQESIAEWHDSFLICG